MSGVLSLIVAMQTPVAVSLGADKSFTRSSPQSVFPNAYAGFRFNGDSTMSGMAAATISWVPLTLPWLIYGPVGDYEVRFTRLSGTPPVGAGMGVWLDLAVTQEISYSQTIVGNKEGDFHIEVRKQSSGIVLDTVELHMKAEITSA